MKNIVTQKSAFANNFVFTSLAVQGDRSGGHQPKRQSSSRLRLVKGGQPRLSSEGGKVELLKQELADLERQQQEVIDSGWQLQYKPEVYATRKPNGKVFGNCTGESGGKGYAYAVSFRDGKKHRKPIAPNQLGEYEAAHRRYLRVQELSRQISNLVRQIDREVAIAAGTLSTRTTDATGKRAGEWDLHDTRLNYPEGAFPHGQFSFVVFQWEVRKIGGGLKRGCATKKFSVAIAADDAEIEAVRQAAIAYITNLNQQNQQ